MRRPGDPSKMAARLKYAMEMQEISAAELARRAGYNRSSISMYLQGEHTPSKDGAERIAQILQVNPAWLMGYDAPIAGEQSADTSTRPAPVAHDLNSRRFIRVGDHVINLDHVVTITDCKDGNVTVLLDTGNTVSGEMQ